LPDTEKSQTVIRRYIDVYNEPDLSRKRLMLSDSFDRAGVYCSHNQLVGFEDVLDMASDFHDEARMDIVGDISVHHDYATFRWQFIETETGEVTTGVDFCEFGQTGLLRKVVVFFD
jgi:hypothetical protein